jgi:hypothetical protein
MIKKKVINYIAMMVAKDMTVLSKLRMSLRIVHGNYMTKVLHLNYLRFKLINVKTIVGITNEVDVLGDHQAVDAHVARFSALFTCYSGFDHFEMIEARVLKLLHKKINLGGEHVHLFKLVNLAGAGLSALLIPALVRGHLLNQFMSFFNTESEERTSSSSIYMLSSCSGIGGNLGGESRGAHS